MRDIALYIVLVILVLPYLAIADVAIPGNLDLEATSSTITVTWSANTNDDEGDNDDGFDDTDGYYIRWQKDGIGDEFSVKIEGVGSGTEEFTITGLEPSGSYTVVITAYSGDEESSTNTETITTDPISSIDFSVEITGVDEVTVSIDAEGTNIDQYSVVVTAADSSILFNGLDFTTNPKVDNDDSQVISGFSPGGYSFEVTIFPDSTTLAVKTFTFEDTQTFLSTVDDDDIEDGCFITVSYDNPKNIPFCIIPFLVTALLIFSRRMLKIGIPFLMLFLCITSAESIAEEGHLYKNNFGIKVGSFLPNESEQKDVYEDIVPFSVFYERMFTEYLSADIDLGYSKSDGTAISTSSSSTELVTELEMYPAAVSVNFNYDVAPYITAYFGVGGDWWLVEEKSELGEFKSEVGGWHAKTGVKIFSDDLDTFKQVGFLIDVSYSEIDRFGQNDIDLGGWKFNFGLMYCM